jgi:hypothetical protein
MVFLVFVTLGQLSLKQVQVLLDLSSAFILEAIVVKALSFLQTLLYYGKELELRFLQKDVHLFAIFVHFLLQFF